MDKINDFLLYLSIKTQNIMNRLASAFVKGFKSGVKSKQRQRIDDIQEMTPDELQREVVFLLDIIKDQNKWIDREVTRIRNNVVFFFWLVVIVFFGWFFVLLGLGSIFAAIAGS